MARKPSVHQLIEHLSCLREVDMMLREGASAADVARFIQDDQKQLPNIPHKTLANALAERKAMLLKAMEDMGGFAEVEYEDEDVIKDRIGAPIEKGIVKTLARAAYKRTKGGIKEHLEQEALYIAQRDRIDFLLKQEKENEILLKQTSAEILTASSILARLTQTKKAMGIIGTGIDEDHIVGDFEGLSKETADVLSQPESRHKVISLVDRLAKRGQLKFKIEPAQSSEEGREASGE